LKTEIPLAQAAARLARTSPESWGQFVSAFEAFTAETTTQCVQSPIDELQRNQGRAQAITRLQNTLSTCRQIADKHERNKK
jgi:hypothetical protein